MLEDKPQDYQDHNYRNQSQNYFKDEDCQYDEQNKS